MLHGECVADTPTRVLLIARFGGWKLKACGNPLGRPRWPSILLNDQLLASCFTALITVERKLEWSQEGLWPDLPDQQHRIEDEGGASHRLQEEPTQIHP